MPVAGRRLREDWHAKEPSAYHVVPNAGHCANMDSSADFNAVLLSFIAQHSGQIVEALGG